MSGEQYADERDDPSNWPDGAPWLKADTDDKAKFHGEATMREEIGYLMSDGVVWSKGSGTPTIGTFAVGEVRRTITTSQWVEVDA